MRAQHVSTSFAYEHCDVPEGLSLGEWRQRNAGTHRRAQVAGGFLAALATFAPIVMSVHGSRTR